MTVSTRPLRRIAVLVVGVAFSLALLELLCWLLLSVNPDWLSRSMIQATLGNTDRDRAKRDRPIGVLTPLNRWGLPFTARESSLPRVREFALHPYLGFVRDPAVAVHRLNELVVDEPVNDQGFFGPSPLEPAADDEVVVAITGGSLAAEFYLYGREDLRADLARRGFAGGAPVRFVCLSLAGMKQPQQLLALTYYLALGARIDFVINIDGFNEIALPLVDNLPTGIPANYPRNWSLYAAKALDERSVLILGRIAWNRQREEAWRARFATFPLRSSNLALVVWRIVSQLARRTQTSLEMELRRDIEATAVLEGRALDFDAESPITPAQLRAGVNLWRRSSESMRRIAESHDITYLHVLQPNQYFPGGRTFTEWERENVLGSETFKYRRAVEEGYPLLIAAGSALASAGHPFLDATDLFAGESESVYKDPCCHINSLGNRILAGAVAAPLSEREDP